MPRRRPRRDATSRHKRKTKAWFERNTAWRLLAIRQIASWMAENGQGAFDDVTRQVVIKRFAKLESFVRVFFGDEHPEPFAHDDAAALIVLPREHALRLARRLFGGGSGIAADLHAEDLTYNMNWFRPRGFR